MNLTDQLDRVTSSRFLENYSGYLIGVLGAIGLIGFAISALDHELFGIIGLTFFSFMWLFFAVMNGNGWRRALKRWGKTLDGWQETSEYASDINSLLNEALTELSTWDREKAQEIAERGQTISLLRMKNMNEKMEKETA